ncbi:MAG: toxin-antitoxin system TumE family protein, partial [Blastocatellia bacterium]
RILYDRLPAMIDEYGYEVWRAEEKLYWYDSQPHPEDETLQITHPHQFSAPGAGRRDHRPVGWRRFTPSRIA